MTQIMWNISLPMGMQQMLAQAPPPNIDPSRPGAAVEQSVDYVGGLLQNLVAFIPNLLAAVLVLLVGWIVAAIAKAITKGILNRTDIDNRIAAGITGRSDSRDLPRVEEWIANFVYWIIILFTVVAVLQTLQLEAVSQPLGGFLNEILNFLPRVVGAAIVLAVAWLVASLVKLLTTRALHAARFDQRLDQRPEGAPRDPNQLSLSDTIGSALYWFIFLLFLIPILDTLGLQQALQPIENLVGEILAILPNILAALLIAAVGWLLATVVRRIVSNLLSSAGFDSLGNRFGLRRTAGGQTLSGIAGTIVYVLILIPVAIAALQALRIEAISVPAIAMLNQILAVIPAIFTAALILFLAYFLGKFVSDLVTSILTSVGFDNIFSALGLPQPRQRTSSSPRVETRFSSSPREESRITPPPGVETRVSPPPREEPRITPPPGVETRVSPPPREEPRITPPPGVETRFSSSPREEPRITPPPRVETTTSSSTGQPTVIQSDSSSTAGVTSRSPSEFIGIIVWVGIMLFATVAAVNILNIPALTALITGLTVILGRILAGLIVFAVGLFLANLTYNIITSYGDRQSQIVGQIARIAIIVLVSAMALQQIGIAQDIVNLAFGLLLGAVAVATALAFGLGSRDLAAQQTRELLDSFRQKRNLPPRN